MAARLAAEEEELEEFRMLEQAAADKCINTLLGMLGDQNKNSMGKLSGCDLHVVFFVGERAREGRKHAKHDEEACCSVILRSGHNVRTPCNS